MKTKAQVRRVVEALCREGRGSDVFWQAAIMAALTLILGLGLAGAQPSGASFLTVDPSPRSHALGGANPVSSLGAQGIHSNPAMAGRMDRKYEFFSAYSSMMEGVQYGHGAFAINRSLLKKGRIEGLGFSFTNLRVGGLEGRDATGNKNGNNFGAQDTAYGMSVSYRLAESLRFGVTGKMVQSEIAGFSSNRSFGADFGLRYQVRESKRPIALGVSLLNFGQGLTFINQGDPLPMSLNMGASVGMGSVTGLAGISRRMNEGTVRMSFGFEVGMGPMSLRASYRTDGGASAAKGKAMGNMAENFTTGMGFKFGAFRMDYAVSQPASELGMSHRVGLTLEWGKTEEEARQEKKDPYTKLMDEKVKELKGKVPGPGAAAK